MVPITFSKEELEVISDALNLTSAALVDHDHIWTEGECSVFNEANALLEEALDRYEDNEGFNG